MVKEPILIQSPAYSCLLHPASCLLPPHVPCSNLKKHFSWYPVPPPPLPTHHVSRPMPEKKDTRKQVPVHGNGA
jgi:hypothetical protein